METTGAHRSAPASAIGARVRSARKRLGWSRDLLAARSGLSSAAIAQLESGRRTQVRPSTLSALSASLGVTIDYLVTGGAAPVEMLVHSALMYRTDEEFVAHACAYVSEGLARGEVVLAVISQRNRSLLSTALGANARGVEFRDAKSWYLDPLAAIEAYRAFLDSKIEEGAEWVRVIGDAVWSGSKEELRLWAEYESLANLAFASSPVTFSCLYDQRLLPPEVIDTALFTHPLLMQKGETKDNPFYLQPGEFVLRPE